MATVTNTIKLPDGTAPSYAAVVIELVASTTSRAAGWITANDTTILSVARPTVAAGAWSASLTPNADIIPSGTVYKVTETADKVRYIHYIEVDSDGGSVFDLLVDAPASLASAALSTHIDDTSGAHAASAISVADADGKVTGTNVETVIAELSDRFTSRSVTLDGNGTGGEQWASGIGYSLTDATNGSRGDSIESDEALGAGATFGFGHYLNFTGANALAGAGAMHGIGIYGEVADAAVYGEAAAIGAVVTNNRDGALAEGFEATVVDNDGGGRNIGATFIMKMNAAVQRWCRGIWLTSTGSQTAGDAVYIDGAAGWSNMIVAKNTSGSVVFQVEADGDVTAGFTHTWAVFRRSDPARFIAWYDGSPEGAVAASPGAVIFNTLGGAGTTMYVKETGTGNTGWAAK